ncbi:DUF378 domain-containing protein [Clostridium sp. FAM 1755]|uniref:DUF378 domain-containing protein n=2 Tax=Clostridium TaxID=1485 RepID=A0A6M0T4S2_CLOBO|nr:MULTISPECIES: DUF378 domain-containing protein [Clostridium]EJP6473836.1 DUF378 domain-containing protein [Clostridium botulinum]KOR25722.1 membrane protein [Clostridium sp. L74]MDS1004691.1 DUF378 domain-containing protein [Clostridium sporogenes]NFA62155.1 DUF378 domain-containing protein [Clostridium botulinum]NFI73216.1 DUF378 domain-containing protein [Clostridium sporogenes]
MRTLDIISLTLVIIGAINWGLIGFFGFNFVEVFFGNMSAFSRILYAIIGIAGLYAISLYGRNRDTEPREDQ